MKYDLKKPCLNCPFRTDKTAIRFSCRERAAEIEETAYRNGFPCHKSAVNHEYDDGEESGYVDDGVRTQHCVGYIIMQLNDSGGGSPWTGIDNDEDLLDRLEAQVDRGAPVFESVEDYLQTNSGDAWRQR